MKQHKKVKITMKSVSTPSGCESDVIELITDGTMRAVEQDGRIGWAISYTDSEATGYAGSVTTVSCFGDSMATMERSGSTEAQLIIEKERKHHCHYGTEYGDMLMGIYTQRIINHMTEDGGDIYFKYTIDINSVLISENEIYMQVTPC